MKSMKTKILFAITLLLALTGIVVAFWVSGVFVNSDEETVNINVGRASDINTIITINDPASDHSTLVPIGTIDNSEGDAVEFMIVPLHLTWLEEDDTSWGEGLRGIFIVSPSVLLVPTNLTSTPLLPTATLLIHPYFFTATTTEVEQLVNGLTNIVENNNNRTIDDLTAILFEIDDEATKDEFEIELVLGETNPTLVYMIVLIDTPCPETFPYIHGATIHVNSEIFLIDDYVEKVLPTPIINVADLISADDNNKLIVGTDGKLLTIPYLSVRNYSHNFVVGPFAGTFHAIVVEISAATSIVSMWGSYGQSYSSPGGAYQMLSPQQFPLLERFIGQVDQWATAIDSNNWIDIRQMPVRITATEGIELVGAPNIGSDSTWSFQFVLILSDSETDGHIDTEN